MKIILAILLLATMGCQADQKPQPIEAHDVCASCKMAISQPRYAAQIVDEDGTAFKFDDIGCLLRYLAAHQLPRARIYIMDYLSEQWLDAEKAVFVKSESIESPMAGGLAAFGEAKAAKEFLQHNRGRIISFSELTLGAPSAEHPQRSAQP